jgi:hypothetical protein
VLHIKNYNKKNKYKIMKNKNFTIQMNPENKSSQLFNKKSLCNSFIAVILLIVLIPLGSSAQNCSLTLTAKNNIESVNSEGRVYFMVLKNNTSEGIDVNFTASNDNTGNNPDASDGSNNVILNASILNKNGVALTGNVHLASNETFEFQVKVTVPSGTLVNHWNNTLLSVSSNKCLNYSTSINLFTFIPVME